MRRGTTLWIAVLVVFGTAPVALAQETTGSISGQVVVTDSTESYIAPVQVYDESGTLVREVMSWVDSNFYVDGLAPGTYKVKAADRWFSSANSFEDADPVIVNAGVDTPGIKINFAASEFGEIEGRIYDAVSGDPVCATALINGIGVRPDESGYYRHGISPGTWKVRFVDNCDVRYSEQWWNGKPDEASGDSLVVAAGATLTGVDAPMNVPHDGGGWISGKVTDVETGDPIAGICVVPFDETGTEASSPPNAARPPTGADGTYRLGFLGFGDFRIQFADCGPFAYEDVWWDGVDTFEEAGVIVVVEGWEVGGIDAQLQLKPGAVRPTSEPVAADDELPFTGLPLGLLVALAVVLVGGGSTVVRSSRPAG